MTKALALIIEDQANLAMLYEDALRLIGYDIIAINNGLDALNHLATHEPPDLVILDVNLPGLSGRDIHKHIRTADRYNDTPVIILTANSLMLNQIRHDAAPNDYLRIKPIGMKELQELAKSLLRGKDGKRTHQAETQKIPHLDASKLEEIDETPKTNPPTVLSPENTMLEDDIASVDPKAKTQEHKAIITPDDDIISTEESESGAN